MSDYNFTEYPESVTTLGIVTDFFIGITLNYSPRWVFTIKDRRGASQKLPWGSLTPDQQKDIFEKHLNLIYKHHFIDIQYTFEFTEKGMLHCHAMGRLQMEGGYGEHTLRTIQATVGQHPIVMKLTGGRKKAFVTANYIHEVCPEKWGTYIRKSIDKTPYKLRTIQSYL